MKETVVHLTAISKNAKTGAIPVSTSEPATCPDSCPLKGNGCYAAGGPLGMHWRKVGTERGNSWGQFCSSIAALPAGQVWRHNQAGDLPGEGEEINLGELAALVRANTGRRGFTYTHKPMDSERNRTAVEYANLYGFTVNLSANTLAHADELASLEIGPVVVVLPAEQTSNTTTPAGRKVVVCPATREGSTVTCAKCKLCANNSETRPIVGFPAHGASKRKASRIAAGE